jgi:hypothetical protein
MAKLDLKRLSADIENSEKERASDQGGRRLTGAMAVVRDNLAEIEALKADGKSWVAIAVGLAQQGVTQGDHQPITAKRLTALIASVKRQAANKAARQALRANRKDLSPPSQPERRVAPVRLARELTEPARPETEIPSMTEEDIRKSNFEKHADLFRKDTNT